MVLADTNSTAGVKVTEAGRAAVSLASASLEPVFPEPASPEGLQARVGQALADSPARVLFLTWNGQRYVIKRVVRKPRGRFKRWLLSALCRMAFPGHVRPGSLKPGDGAWESARLQSLAQAGERVPEQVLDLPEAKVYAHCGTTLSEVLRGLPRAERQTLMGQALGDLARFHRAGHWHGGAQFRNVLLPEGPEGADVPGGAVRFCRIDFEENLAQQFSLPLLQVYDLALFLSDALSHLDMGGQGGQEGQPPMDPVAFGEGLMRDYQAVHWHPDMSYVLGRLALLARGVVWLAPLIRRFGNKDSRRTLALARLIVWGAGPRGENA